MIDGALRPSTHLHTYTHTHTWGRGRHLREHGAEELRGARVVLQVAQGLEGAPQHAVDLCVCVCLRTMRALFMDGRGENMYDAGFA